MKLTEPIRNRTIIIVQTLIIVLECAGFAIGLSLYGLSIFGMYTQESNLVLLVTSIFYLIFKLRGEQKMGSGLKKAILTAHFVAVCLVSVTFTVVLFCFVPLCVPTMGIGGGLYAMLIREANFAHHLLCPVLATVCYLVFERDLVPGKKECFIAMLPTLCYAIVSTSLNIAKVVRGPYPFLYVYEQPVIVSVIWFFAIPGGGWLFAKFVAFLAGKAQGVKKTKREGEA